MRRLAIAAVTLLGFHSPVVSSNTLIEYTHFPQAGALVRPLAQMRRFCVEEKGRHVFMSEHICPMKVTVHRYVPPILDKGVVKLRPNINVSPKYESIFCAASRNYFTESFCLFCPNDFERWYIWVEDVLDGRFRNCDHANGGDFDIASWRLPCIDQKRLALEIAFLDSIRPAIAVKISPNLGLANLSRHFVGFESGGSRSVGSVSGHIRVPNSEAQTYEAQGRKDDLRPRYIDQLVRRFRHAPLLAQVALIIGYGVVAWGLYAYGIGRILERRRLPGWLSALAGSGLVFVIVAFAAAMRFCPTC